MLLETGGAESGMIEILIPSINVEDATALEASSHEILLQERLLNASDEEREVGEICDFGGKLDSARAHLGPVKPEIRPDMPQQGLTRS